MTVPVNKKFRNVDEYLSTFDPEIRSILESLRKTIKAAAPEAEEVISYNMPAFKFHGILVYYAAHKEHIGFYPAGSNVVELFKNELKDYKTSRGTIQFPFRLPIPHRLVKKIVRYRAQANLEKVLLNRRKK